MNYPRKTIAAVAFVFAFAAAIGLTTFLQLRPANHPSIDTPAPPVNPPSAAHDNSFVSHRVEQVVIDFSTKRIYTTLLLQPRAGEKLPAKVWVSTDCFPINAEAAGQLENQMEPTEVNVMDRNRLEVVTPCSICDKRPANKPTYYARVHVGTDRNNVEGMRFIAGLSGTPVIVQGLDQ